ncbi:MAG: Arc family DNA-binding protein, partial [Rhodospirillaceae bacterium]
MPTLTIRNVEEDVMEQLKKRAKQNERSLEAEVRQILKRETRLLSGAEAIALSRRLTAMTPKDVKQTDSALLLREDR